MSRKYYVVLHDGVGKWKRGNVVAESVLIENGCDIDRLLMLHAMRGATEHEAQKNHVDLTDPGLHLSYEHMLAEKEKLIATLTSRVSHLEEQIAAGTHIEAARFSNVNHAGLIEAKDQIINKQHAETSDLKVKLARLERELSVKEAAAKEAASKTEGPFPMPKLSVAPPLNVADDGVPDSAPVAHGGLTTIRKL